MLDTSLKEQTNVQSLPSSNYSSSFSSNDNIFEKVKIASPYKDSDIEAIPILESIEGNTAMKEDIVDELLKAKEDNNLKSDSKNVVTKDNEISDKLNRLESLILYLLKEKTEVSPISAPNFTRALSTFSDLNRSDAFFIFRISFSGIKLYCSGS